MMIGLAVMLSLAGPRAQVRQTFENLQYFPKDIKRDALLQRMREFSFALDVRCEHCHVGEGNDLSKFDFASDTKPTKSTARAMMKMLETINRESLKEIGDPARQPKLTCYTCHRGAKQQLTAPPPGGGLRP